MLQSKLIEYIGVENLEQLAERLLDLRIGPLFVTSNYSDEGGN